jgi:hypothetical protein
MWQLGQIQEETRKIHKAKEAMKNLSSKMGPKSQRKGQLRQKTQTQTAWKRETRKPKPTRRDQEVLEESEKAFAVYV